jgi:hypothetical protein
MEIEELLENGGISRWIGYDALGAELLDGADRGSRSVSHSEGDCALDHLVR